MARRVFFSFHFQNDSWRVSQIRNSGVTRDWRSNPFLDKAEWESIRRRGDGAVKNWIDAQLNGTGVTVVLIGSKTATRPYVRYEIQESHERGNGMLGIFIHKLRDQRQRTSTKGTNPFSQMTTTVEEPTWFGFSSETKRKRLSAIYPTYDWIRDDGYQNIGKWIEEAARRAGR